MARSALLLVLVGSLGCEGSLAVVDAGDAMPALTDGGLGDAGALDAGALDAGALDAGADAAPFVPPNAIFFVGNSFTFGGAVPELVEDLATYAGFPPPNVESRAVGGRSLQWHREDTAADGAPARVAEGWDVVVLQEFSTRPTDQVGPAMRFKEDATWFYDLAKDAAPQSEVILYETWARHADHSIYPATFADPEEMQAELRFHYRDAAERYIPASSRSERPADVRVAPAGDAWEVQLAEPAPIRLHASDDYHASAAGAYLNALVIFSTIYGRRADGAVPLRGLDEPTALALQASADRVSGASGWGPVFGRPLDVSSGSLLRLDFGALWVDGWSPHSALFGTVGPMSTASGEATSVRVTTHGFDGRQEGGSPTNDLSLPLDVSRDSLWLGSFDGHAAALELEARVVLRGLPPEGRYRLEIFASRAGTDSGRGRLTRYRIEERAEDLEVSDNVVDQAIFDGVSPDERGEVVIRVGVSPAGGARFAYIGALRVTRVD